MHAGPFYICIMAHNVRYTYENEENTRERLQPINNAETVHNNILRVWTMHTMYNFSLLTRYKMYKIILPACKGCPTVNNACSVHYKHVNKTKISRVWLEFTNKVQELHNILAQQCTIAHYVHHIQCIKTDPRLPPHRYAINSKGSHIEPELLW